MVWYRNACSIYSAQYPEYEMVFEFLQRKIQNDTYHSDDHQFQHPSVHALPWIQWSCHVTPCVCNILNSQANGNGKKYAYGGVLLGIRADGNPFGITLGNSDGDISQSLTKKKAFRNLSVDTAFAVSPDCRVWIRVLCKKRYCLLYVLEKSVCIF